VIILQPFVPSHQCWRKCYRKARNKDVHLGKHSIAKQQERRDIVVERVQYCLRTMNSDETTYIPRSKFFGGICDLGKPIPHAPKKPRLKLSYLFKLK